MSKIEICTKVTSNPFMIREFFTVIRSYRMDLDRQRLQELDHSICHGLRGFALDLPQEGQAGLPLGQGNNCLAMSFSDYCIYFPITQALACIHDSWPLVDAYPVLEPSATIVAPIALSPLFLAS